MANNKKTSNTAVIRTVVQSTISIIVVIAIGLIMLQDSGVLDSLVGILPAQFFVTLTALTAIAAALTGWITKMMYIPQVEEFINKNVPFFSYLNTRDDEEGNEDEDTEVDSEELH